MVDQRFDPRAVLAPFPGEMPAGEDPRADTDADSLFRQLQYEMREGRSKERTALSGQSEYISDDAMHQVRGHWQRVAELGHKILAEKGKDLEVAAILAEALVREHGAAGLVEGLDLMAFLIEEYLGPRAVPKGFTRGTRCSYLSHPQFERGNQRRSIGESDFAS